MRVEPLLVPCDDIVADLRQGDGLAVGGKAAQHESAKDRAADQQHDARVLVGKGLIDHGLHDRGGKARGRGDDSQAGNSKEIAADVIATVFCNDSLQDSGDGVGIDCMLFFIFSAQKACLP
ncbi:hypothetical protein FQZ97_977840 [compost metagenome]